MTNEEAIEEINKVFVPEYANYIITALAEGAITSNKCEDCVNKVKLCKKLKKIRKEKKRWKNKYLELYNYVKLMEDTTFAITKDPMWERINAGLGLPPIRIEK